MNHILQPQGASNELISARKAMSLVTMHESSECQTGTHGPNSFSCNGSPSGTPSLSLLTAQSANQPNMVNLAIQQPRLSSPTPCLHFESSLRRYPNSIRMLSRQKLWNRNHPNSNSQQRSGQNHHSRSRSKNTTLNQSVHSKESESVCSNQFKENCLINLVDQLPYSPSKSKINPNDMRDQTESQLFKKGHMNLQEGMICSSHLPTVRQSQKSQPSSEFSRHISAEVKPQCVAGAAGNSKYSSSIHNDLIDDSRQHSVIITQFVPVANSIETEKPTNRNSDIQIIGQQIENMSYKRDSSLQNPSLLLQTVLSNLRPIVIHKQPQQQLQQFDPKYPNGVKSNEAKGQESTGSPSNYSSYGSSLPSDCYRLSILAAQGDRKAVVVSDFMMEVEGFEGNGLKDNTLRTEQLVNDSKMEVQIPEKQQITLQVAQSCEKKTTVHYLGHTMCLHASNAQIGSQMTEKSCLSGKGDFIQNESAQLMVNQNNIHNQITQKKLLNPLKSSQLNSRQQLQSNQHYQQHQLNSLNTQTVQPITLISNPNRQFPIPQSNDPPNLLPAHPSAFICQSGGRLIVDGIYTISKRTLHRYFKCKSRDSLKGSGTIRGGTTRGGTIRGHGSIMTLQPNDRNSLSMSNQQDQSQSNSKISLYLNLQLFKMMPHLQPYEACLMDYYEKHVLFSQKERSIKMQHHNQPQLHSKRSMMSRKGN